jgi:FkbM family methyltransferase
MGARDLVLKEVQPGLRLLIDRADRGVGLHIRRGRYELNELDFVLRHLQDGQHALDIGAHVGLYTMHMARVVGPSGSVYAFEPLEESAACLELGIRENGFEDRITLARAAVGRHRGRASLVYASGWQNPGAAFIALPDYRPGPGEELRTVAAVAVDDLAMRRPVALIKIDVEGGEADVLTGAHHLLEADRPLVLSEVHALPASRARDSDAVSLMRRVGYRAYELGAGVIGAELTAAPSRGVASVVFVPERLTSRRRPCSSGRARTDGSRRASAPSTKSLP